MLGSGHERLGAAGFPFPPVAGSHRPAVDDLAARLTQAKPHTARPRRRALAGWVALSREPSPLIAHWGAVSHLQTHLTRRNQASDRPR